MRSAREGDRLWWLASTKKSHVYEARLRGECFKSIWNCIEFNKTNIFYYFRPKWMIIIQTTCKKVNSLNNFLLTKKKKKRGQNWKLSFVKTATRVLNENIKKERNRTTWIFCLANSSCARYYVVERTLSQNRLSLFMSYEYLTNEIYMSSKFYSNLFPILCSTFPNECKHFDSKQAKLLINFILDWPSI